MKQKPILEKRVIAAESFHKKDVMFYPRYRLQFFELAGPLAIA
jgi:hypothetical protein